MQSSGDLSKEEGSPPAGKAEPSSQVHLDYQLARYALLADLWSHHNAVQLQWPAVIIGASLVVVPLVLEGKEDAVRSLSNWGTDHSVVYAAGVPLLLAGLAIAAMLYIMGRGQRIMAAIEEDLGKMDEVFGVDRLAFRRLNHPSGISGSRIMRGFMSLLLSLPMSFLGWCFIFGLERGIYFWLLQIILWLCLEQSAQIYARRIFPIGQITGQQSPRQE